jgi:uncharacterized membrane protein YeaQ/YmgE (transglycosylase-associated protein family)
MSILGWLVVGLLAGWLAALATGSEGRGCLGTMAVGIVGALIGGALFRIATGGDFGAFQRFDLASVLVAFVGATVLLLLLQAVGVDSRSRRR